MLSTAEVALLCLENREIRLDEPEMCPNIKLTHKEVLVVYRSK